MASGATTATTVESPQSAERMGLGRDAFMQLLVAQLRYQDPLNPMDDRDFVVQLAQLNTVEQLQALNDSFTMFMVQQNLLQGTDLLGHTVRGLSTTGEGVEGVVSRVSVLGGMVTLYVDGHHVPLMDVYEVMGSRADGAVPPVEAADEPVAPVESGEDTAPPAEGDEDATRPIEAADGDAEEGAE
jgi:flagellar basal-body rod modification protein FlgD